MEIKKILIRNSYLILIGILTLLISCSSTETQESSSVDTIGPPTGKIDQSKQYSAVFDTEVGEFTILLYDDKAPYTVENFINLANTFSRYSMYEDALNVYRISEKINPKANFGTQKAQLYAHLGKAELMIELFSIIPGFEIT